MKAQDPNNEDYLKKLSNEARNYQNLVNAELKQKPFYTLKSQHMEIGVCFN